MAEATEAAQANMPGENGTDVEEGRSAYFTNMITWFLATGAIVAAVLILAVINCCIDNRETLKKLVGLSKSKHPHIPKDEKRIRRDHMGVARDDDDHETQVHMLWSRFFRQSASRDSHA